jgi:hypothetical protein
VIPCLASGQRRDRSYYFRAVGTAEDPAERLVARTELSWHGPWLDSALPRVAALAADPSRPRVARLAKAVHEQIARQLDSDR